MNANLYALLRSHFPGDPSAPCLEPEDDGAVSYGDLDTGSAVISRLLGELDVEKGDRVVVQADKSPRAVLLYLACLRRGAVYVPLNPAYTPSEVFYFLSDSEPKLFVCTAAAAEELAPVAEAAGVPHLLTMDPAGDGTLAEACAGLAPDPAVAATAADDLAAILYTSGTTGRSKGAMLSHRNLASNALALHRIWGWAPGDVLLHVLPIFHVHGLFVALHCALLNGSPILFMPRFDAEGVLRLLPRATVMMGVPTFYTRLLEQPGLTPEISRGMRLFISGSAPLLEETFHAWERRTGHRILERYGMTEAGMITSNPLEGERIAGTVGFPLPDVEARIADDRGKVLPPGETGILEIRGPNVFKGYWRMPDKTAAEFRDDGFFITGDLARMDADGRVSIVGRARDLIISGGFNVYPKEVELLIDDIAGVGESAVFGVYHPDFGEAVAAAVTRSGAGGVTEAEILEALSRRLARFKLPKRIYFVDELPRNAMGKVQKNQLRDRYGDAFRT